jgi:hypothetical protein
LIDNIDIVTVISKLNLRGKISDNTVHMRCPLATLLYMARGTTLYGPPKPLLIFMDLQSLCDASHSLC